MKKILILIFVILSTFSPVFCANNTDLSNKMQQAYKSEFEKIINANYTPSFIINSDKIRPNEILIKLKVKSDGTIINAQTVKNTEPRLGSGVLEFLNKTKQIQTPIGYNSDYYVLLSFQDKQNQKRILYVNIDEDNIEKYILEREWQFKRLEAFNEKLSKCKIKGEDVVFVSTQPDGKILNVSFEDKSGSKKDLQDEIRKMINEIKLDVMPLSEKRFYLTIFSYKNDGSGAKITPEDNHPYLKVEWGPYMKKLETKIKNNWNPPKDAVSKRVVVIYTVEANGNIENIKITTSSGSIEADEAAINAIKKSSPVEPLPDSFPNKSVDIEFTFDYNVLYGGNFSKQHKNMYTCTDGSCNTNPNQFGTHLHY